MIRNNNEWRIDRKKIRYSIKSCLHVMKLTKTENGVLYLEKHLQIQMQEYQYEKQKIKQPAIRNHSSGK